MNFSTSFTNKLISLILYSALLIITVSAGVKTINLTLDRMFITSFILGWQQVVITLQEKEPIFPPMQNKQLVSGMNEIVRLSKKHSIHLPKSNTRHSYAHVLKKLNQPEQHIFLITDQDRLIIYGLHQQTMERIDKQIDGKAGLSTGKFTAQQGKNRATYTGIWTL